MSLDPAEKSWVERQSQVSVEVHVNGVGSPVARKAGIRPNALESPRRTA